MEKENQGPRDAFCKLFSCLLTNPAISLEQNIQQQLSNNENLQKKAKQLSPLSKHAKNKSSFEKRKMKTDPDQQKQPSIEFKLHHRYASSAGFYKSSHLDQFCWTENGKISISNSIKNRFIQTKKEEVVNMMKKVNKNKLFSDLKFKRTESMEQTGEDFFKKFKR